MHLEVMLQNVKKPKSDRNSGNVRNLGDSGTFNSYVMMYGFFNIYNFVIIKASCILI
jgi:hypothetical protein